jgi:hypothetical protein
MKESVFIEDKYIEMYTHHVFTKDKVTINELTMRQGRRSCRIICSMYGTTLVPDTGTDTTFLNKN